MTTVELLGYRISNKGLAGDINSAWEFIESRLFGHYMACANPHSLVLASRDPLFEAALKNADVLLPDGTGIILAAMVLHLPLHQKVAGHDFFMALTKLAERNGGLKYFLLGSSEKVLSLIVGRLRSEFPSIKVCGTYSPPFTHEFSDEENAKMVEAVNAAQPDLLWVGMTAPKQEKWVYKNRHALKVPFVGAVGAVFDFYAGTRKRSSRVWVRMGLEWLPRFLREPRRLWERNIKSTPIFLSWVIKEKINRRSGGRMESV